MAIKSSRRRKGDGSLSRRADGRWVAIVDLPVGPDGKRRRKSVSSTSYAVAAKKLRALRQEVEEHGDTLDDSLTVGAWLHYWVTEIAPERVKPRTAIGYEGYIANYLVPHLGRYKLTALAPEHIRAMLRAMGKIGPSGQPKFSESTRRQAFAILRRALVVAQREQKIRFNPALAMDPPRVATNHRVPFTLPEARAIIGQLDVQRDPDEASRFLVALLEGIRQGEALGLTWDNVDLPGRRFRIEKTIQRIKGQGLVVGEPKSKMSKRWLPLLAPVHYALSALPHRTGYVWPAAPGDDTSKPRDPARDWRDWQDLLARAGLEKRALHAARSTTASLLDQSGTSPKIISEILGHSQINLAQDVYVHGDTARHIEAGDALTALLAGS